MALRNLAAAFCLAAVAGLPAAVTRAADLPRPLGAVVVTGKTVTLVALDGYASEIPWADVTSLDWIVGIRRDGRRLGLGQEGPLWVV